MEGTLKKNDAPRPSLTADSLFSCFTVTRRYFEFVGYDPSSHTVVSTIVRFLYTELRGNTGQEGLNAMLAAESCEKG